MIGLAAKPGGLRVAGARVSRDTASSVRTKDTHTDSVHRRDHFRNCRRWYSLFPAVDLKVEVPTSSLLADVRRVALPLLLKLQEVARDALDVLNIAIRLLRVLHDEALHLDQFPTHDAV